MSLVSKDNNIFRDIGVSSSAAIAISLFKLVATILTTVKVDTYSKQVLLYIGLAALIVLAVAFIYPYSSIEECNAYHAQAMCPSSCSWNSDQSFSCDTIACSVISNSSSSLYPTTCCSSTLISTQKIIMRYHYHHHHCWWYLCRWIREEHHLYSWNTL